MLAILIRHEKQYALFTSEGVYKEYTPETVGNAVVHFMRDVCDVDENGKIQKSILYMNDLHLIGKAVYKTLINAGYTDDTKSTGGVLHKTPLGGLTALISADLGIWYGLSCKNFRGAMNYIYNLENLVGGVSADDILKDKPKDDKIKIMPWLCKRYWELIRTMIRYSGGGYPMTTSSTAYHRWSTLTNLYDRNTTYVDMYKKDCDLYGCTMDEYLRPAYKGGWCYMHCPASKVYHNGITLDVNSLYPYVMKANRFPVLAPIMWVGKLPENLQRRVDRGVGMFFIHISCKFDIKDGYLPFVQIPNDIYRRGVRRTSKIKNSAGVVDEPVELWFTDREYELFKKHYKVRNLKIYDGAFFQTANGVFTDYVNEYYALKRLSKNNGDEIGVRLSKIMLNGLSGSFAKKRERLNVLLNKQGEPENTVMSETTSKSLIHIGACITSYARCLMVETAQKNIDRFLYCDTDSLHMIGTTPPPFVSVGEELGQFKIERRWRTAVFLKQKVYVEQDDTPRKEGRGEYYPCHLTYAGIPKDVQRRIEERLDFFSLWEDGGEINEYTEKTFLSDEPFKNIRYIAQVNNGTFNPSLVTSTWDVDFTNRENNKRAEIRSMRGYEYVEGRYKSKKSVD